MVFNCYRRHRRRVIPIPSGRNSDPPAHLPPAGDTHGNFVVDRTTVFVCQRPRVPPGKPLNYRGFSDGVTVDAVSNDERRDGSLDAISRTMCG